MRIRSVKPEFWEDEDVAALPPLTRLYFIGLWNLADDAGYLRWSVVGVAAALFRYDSKGRRERAVTDAMARLVTAGMAEVLDCGRHALVPNLPKHQRLSGETRRVHTYLREHEEEASPHIPAEERGESPHIPAPRTQRPASPRPRARRGVREVEVGEVEDQGGGTRDVPPRGARSTGSRSATTNGSAAIDESIAMANDETKADSVRRAARAAVERHAPDRLGEIGATS